MDRDQSHMSSSVATGEKRRGGCSPPMAGRQKRRIKKISRSEHFRDCRLHWNGLKK